MKVTGWSAVSTTEITRDRREDGDSLRSGLTRKKRSSRSCTHTHTDGDKRSISVTQEGDLDTVAFPLTRKPRPSPDGMKCLHLSGGNLRTNKGKGGKP